MLLNAPQPSGRPLGTGQPHISAVLSWETLIRSRLGGDKYYRARGVLEGVANLGPAQGKPPRSDLSAATLAGRGWSLAGACVRARGGDWAV